MEAELALVDTRDIEAHSNWTALHWAFSRGHVEVAELLLKHGADPKLTDKQNRDARGIAEQKRQKKCIDLIDSHC